MTYACCDNNILRPDYDIAMDEVFNGSSQILHVTLSKKLSKKVGGFLNFNMNFNNRFKSCSWNSKYLEELNLNLNNIKNDFNLEEND